MPRIPRLFPFLALMLAAGGCASASGPWVSLGGQRYRVEIADTDAERARGLMFRDELRVVIGILLFMESVLLLV